MDAYWSQKKKMAPGCEPHAVTCLMTSLRAHAHGMSLAGAGGGGFLYVLFREPKTVEQVVELLKDVKVRRSLRAVNDMFSDGHLTYGEINLMHI